MHASRPLPPRRGGQFHAPDLFLLTIVTINRDNEAGLPKTLQSLEKVRQHPDVECIFVDGASADRSVDIARSFYAPDNLISEPDTGIYSAMNKGLSKARGKYVLWLNSGDELHESLNVGALLVVLRNSSAHLISGATLFCSYSTGAIRDIFRPKVDKLPYATLPHPSSFFLRTGAIELGGYDESFKIAGDRDLIVRIHMADRPIEVIEHLIARFYDGGISDQALACLENKRINFQNGLISRLHYFAGVLLFWVNSK